MEDIEMASEPTTPTEASRPTTPELHSFYSYDRTPEHRHSWQHPPRTPPDNKCIRRGDHRNPLARWLNHPERAERLRADAPRLTTRVLGLGLLEQFVAGVPGLTVASVFHVFDGEGAYVGWRPKVATWGWKGEVCEQGWTED